MMSPDLQRGGSLPPKTSFFLLVLGAMSQSTILLALVWQAYDRLRNDNPPIDTRDLERSITQFLDPRIRRAM